MTEIRKILAEWIRAKEHNEACALATVVKVVGSAYRRPGARMLITNDGRTTIGTISGGCLERDVAERAPAVLRAGNSAVIEYDTTSSEDIVWGLGLGCNGLVQVLLESVTAESHAARLLDFVGECLSERQTGVVATVIHLDNQTDAKVGQHLMLHADGSVQNDIGNSELAALILTDARTVFNKRRAELRQYELREGDAEVFIELIEPPVPLVIFGADHDAVPVAEFARNLGWHVTVVDPRARAATRERFDSVDEVVLCRADKIAECVALENRTAAVVMSHNYTDDLAMLRALLSSPVGYLGILGPKHRTENMLQELRAENENFDDSRVEKLHSPIGLDIGADTPEEIALSIVAEIKAALVNRQGGLLKHRNAPIHDVTDGTYRTNAPTNKTRYETTEQTLTSVC